MALALKSGKALVVGDLLATTHAGLLREFDRAFEDLLDFFLDVCVFLQILCFELLFLLSFYFSPSQDSSINRRNNNQAA